MYKLTVIFSLSALTLSACNLKKDSDKRKTVPVRKNSTHFISIDSANKMISSYLGSLDSNSSVPNLLSVTFNASDLRAYLSDLSITGVKISLAHQLSFINQGNANVPSGYKSNALAFVISAFDANGNYVYSNNQVIDYGAMCPTVCPFGQAGNALFPTIPHTHD